MGIERQSHLLAKESGVSPGSEFFITTDECEDPEFRIHLTMCGQYHCVSGYVIDRLFYDCLLIAYIEHGAMEITYEGEHYTAQAGEVVFMDLRQPHRYAASASLNFSWLHIIGEPADRIYQKYRFKGGIILRGEGCNEINKNLRLILSAFKTGQLLNQPELASALYKIVLYTLTDTAAPESTKTRQAGTVAIEYMRYNIGNPISLNDVADAVHMSKYHFIRSFKKSTGYSPYEYLLRMRMEAARHLLHTTDKTVGEIAAAVGYKSEMGFSSAFSEKTGISPGRFRSSPF